MRLFGDVQGAVFADQAAGFRADASHGSAIGVRTGAGLEWAAAVIAEQGGLVPVQGRG